MERKTKTVFQLATPFTTTEWPEISTQNQEITLELLCSLVSPIGQWRLNNIIPSKGKRSKKRKRQEAKLGAVSDDVKPPCPEISSFLEIGLNNITRRLQYLSAVSTPNTASEIATEDTNASPILGGQKLDQVVDSNPSTHFAAIFVIRPSQPTLLHAHLPQLVAIASMAHPQLPASRLVQLPLGCDARFCEALGLARVSFIGLLEGAPHSKSLLDLVRNCVPEVEVPWLREAKDAAYLPVKINAIEVLAPVAKEKEGKKEP